MSEEKKNPPHRPKIHFDWDQLDALLAIQCTEEECGSVLKCSIDTLRRRCLEEHGVTFAEYSEKRKGFGRASLRRRQWKTAENNAVMQIFLGKNWLNQSDNVKQEIAHQPIEIKIEREDTET